MALIMSDTTICFRTQFCTLSILKGDPYNDSLHFPLDYDQFLKLGVSKQSGLTAICHYCEYTLIECSPFHPHWPHWFYSHMSLLSTGIIHSPKCFNLSSAHFCLPWCCPAFRMHSNPVQLSFSFLVHCHKPFCHTCLRIETNTHTR